MNLRRLFSCVGLLCAIMVAAGWIINGSRDSEFFYIELFLMFIMISVSGIEFNTDKS